MKIAKKDRRMIDIVVDADAGSGMVFEPPEGIDAAVKNACAIAGYEAPEPTLCIRFTANAEIRALNHQWRNKDAVTDVLSFPMQEAPFDLDESLGDIALAVPFARQEADRLHVAVDAHILHLIIHASLHLLGFDHINDDEADRMQGLESETMQRMGLHNPYSFEARVQS